MEERTHVAPGYFAIAVLPLLIFFLHSALLQAFAATDPGVPASLVTGAPWQEAAGRLRYLGAYWLFAALALLAAAVMVWDLARPLTLVTRLAAVVTLAVILAAVAAVTLENVQSPDDWRIWHLLGREAMSAALGTGALPGCAAPGDRFLLGACGEVPVLTFFDRSLDAMNLFAAIGVGAQVIGMILCLDQPVSGRPTPEHLAGALVRMRRQLYVTGLLLVSGMLFAISWMTWPVALIAPEAREGYRALASALEVFTGIHFSLLILSFYVPSALILVARIRHMAAAAVPRGTAEARAEWRATHGLDSTATDLLRAGFAVAAPALTGLAGGLAPLGL